MPDALPRWHILSYDITDPKRLGRVHRYMRKQGLPIQYSVFLVYTDRAGLELILNALDALIDPHSDDIRAYPLPRRLDFLHLGRQLFPLGVSLYDAALPPGLFHEVA